MGQLLVPKTVRTMDAVTYFLTSSSDAGWLAWVLLLSAMGGVFVALRVPSAILVFYALFAAIQIARTELRTELTVGLHRVRLRERCFGIPIRTRHIGWDELLAAELVQSRVVLIRRDGRRLYLAARGPLGQLAWIVGELNGQIRRTRLLGFKADRLGMERLKLEGLLGTVARRAPLPEALPETRSRHPSAASRR